MGLCKLQGQVVTHFEKVVWWKSFRVECVNNFSYNSYTPGVEAVSYSTHAHLDKNFLLFLVSLKLPSLQPTASWVLNGSMFSYSCLNSSMTSSTCMLVGGTLYEWHGLVGRCASNPCRERIFSASAPIVATLLHHQIQPCQDVFMLHLLLQVVGQHITAVSENKNKIQVSFPNLGGTVE